MGAYYYVTSPKLTAQARVRFPDGREDTITLALYRYAYKPYGQLFRSSEDAKLNRRMDMRSGAMACRAAYKRSGDKVPAYGIMFNDDKKALYALEDASQTFRTKGRAGGLDDYDFCNYDGAPVILEYLSLPAGLTVHAPQPAPQPL